MEIIPYGVPKSRQLWPQSQRILGAWLTYSISTVQEELLCSVSVSPSRGHFTIHWLLVPSQVDENLKALDVKITSEINTKIEAILQN